jgi:phosphoribosylanthranilate isomerase
MTTLVTPQIKICGICSVEDAQLAVRYGAKYIGLIFVKSSPRYVEPVIAKSIAESLGNNAQIVGVFQNSSLEEIENIASVVGLDYLQLHGQESPDLCSRLSKPVIKVFELVMQQDSNSYLSVNADNLYHLSQAAPFNGYRYGACIPLPVTTLPTGKYAESCLSILQSYKPYCQYFLFDKPKTNTNENWLECVTQYLKTLEPTLSEYFLAGGLNASNIQKVLDELNPAAIDIASGVEQTTRIKSEVLIAEFCSQILTQNQNVQTPPVKIQRLNAKEHHAKAKTTTQNTKNKSCTIANRSG